MYRTKLWKRIWAVFLIFSLILSSGGVLATVQGSSELLGLELATDQLEAPGELSPDHGVRGTAAEAGDFQIVDNVLVKYIGSSPVVTVPEGVTAIGEQAFFTSLQGNGITAIYLPDSLTTLQDYAFSGCHTMTEITLPSNLATIGKGVFYFSKGLENIYVDQNNQHFTGDNGVLFNKDKTLLLCYPQARTQPHYEIPTTVEVIADHGFDNAINLTTITMAQGITDIGEHGFRDNSLRELTLPQSLKTLGTSAFARSKSLKSITIPKGVENWGNVTFFYSLELEEVEFEKGLTAIGDRAFLSCSSLKKAIIPETVTSIGVEAFAGCPQLTIYGQEGSYGQEYAEINNIPFAQLDQGGDDTDSHFEIVDTILIKYTGPGGNVVIPPGVTAIREGAFYGQRTVVSVIIPPGVTEIGKNAFRSCTALERVEIPNTVTTIGDRAFHDCQDLVEIELPDSVLTLGQEAFFHCISLRRAVLSANIKVIQERTFSGCSQLRELVLPANLTLIGASAYFGCTGLTELELPKNVSIIAESAFSGCSNLTSLTLSTAVTGISGDSYWGSFAGCNIKTLTITYHGDYPVVGSAISNINNPIVQVFIEDNITEIGDRAFYDYGSLITISFPSTVTKIGDEAFAGCSNLISLSSLNRITSIGRNAFGGCSKLTSGFLQFEDLKSIGELAFNHCPQIGELYIPKEVEYIGANAFLHSFYSNHVLLRVYKNSYGHRYAVENQIPYYILDFQPDNDPVTGVSLLEGIKTIFLGSPELLVHVVAPATAGNKNVTWQTSNPEVVEVDKWGYVTGLQEGTATITVTTEEGGFTASCLVTVLERIDSHQKYEQDLVYMALSSMADYDFTPLDGHRTCQEIVENSSDPLFSEAFIGDLTKGDFIREAAGAWRFVGAYNNNFSWLNSGYYGAAFLNENTQELVLASRGTENFDDVLEDFTFGAGGWLGGQFKDSDQFYKLMKRDYPLSTITTTGHSLGGALATNLAQKYQLKARVFNAPSATYATYIWDDMFDFSGMDSWDIIDYTNEYDVIGNCGIGDNIPYGTEQFAHYLIFPRLNKTVYDFIRAGNTIAWGGALDKTIICNDRALLNDLPYETWSTHAMASLVKVAQRNGEPYYRIDRKETVNQKLPYLAQGIDRIDMLYTKLFLGSTGSDTLITSHILAHNVMYGGQGSDTLIAGLAADALVGGLGTNSLEGGSGWDKYYFTRATMNGDIINDPSGQDKIYLMDVLLSELAITEEVKGGASYLVVGVKGSNSRIYLNKNRSLLAPPFVIVDGQGHEYPVTINTPLEARATIMASSRPVLGPVQPLVIKGTSTIELYNLGGELITTFSNQTDSRHYGNYGYFYGFAGEHPYTLVYLFNGEYRTVVTSPGAIDYTLYSLNYDDTPLLSFTAQAVDLSGGKALVTNTPAMGELPQLMVEQEGQEPQVLAPQVVGLGKQLTLSQNNLALQVAQRAQLTIQDQVEAILWSSSDPTVVEVDEQGLVTAKAQGTVLITAATTDGQRTAVCYVQVFPKEPVEPVDPGMVIPTPGKGDCWP